MDGGAEALLEGTAALVPPFSTQIFFLAAPALAAICFLKLEP